MEPQYKKGISWWPGLKILDRYIIRKFVGTYLFAIAMIVVVVVVFDYVEKIDDFATTQAPLKSIFLDYYLNFVPFFVNQFSALFTFIACIFFTSKLAHRTEIVAMLSGGMSFRRLMWPYFISASMITAISLVLSLWVIPISQRSCVAFEEQYIPRRKAVQYERHIYRQISPGTFLYIRGFSPSSLQASFMALESYEDGAMRSVLDASDVKFDPETKRWTAQRYITRNFDEKGVETFQQNRNLDTLLNLDIVELGKMQSLVKTMNITELNTFIEQQRTKGSDLIRQFEVEHHTRYAYPLGTFILTLIGVSLSSRKTRGGTGLHIGVGIVLCFSYILLNRIFEEFAKGGSLPTLLAVWLPNIVYIIIAIYLYRKAPK
ncbi:MAG: LptF/LptG family permease [Alistipes sp.]|nr:LptF/LptG family permease [Alistipes sp.]